MTFARVHYFFRQSGGGEAAGTSRSRRSKTGSIDPPELTVAFLRDANIYPCPTATLIRRSALQTVGGFEERFRKVRTDMAVWAKLSLNFPVRADSAFVARYRQHGQSSVAQLFSDPDAHRKNEMEFWSWLLDTSTAFRARIRREPETLACRQVLRLILADVTKEKPMSAFAWRRAVLPRLLRFPAFRREARWLRVLFSPGNDLGFPSKVFRISMQSGSRGIGRAPKCAAEQPHPPEERVMLKNKPLHILD